MFMDASPVDLALLPVLRELLRTRSTTLTAARLGCTQSSASHALARLRRQLGDPLLVRVGRTLSPTKYAEDLAPRLDALLGEIAGALARPGAFEAKTLERSFTFAGTDFSEALLLPRIVRRLTKEAPRVDLVCIAAGADVEHRLQERDVDLAFGTLFRDRAGLVVKKVVSDDLVLVMRKDHPLRSKLDVDSYATAGHVLVAPRGSAGGQVDTRLGAQGRKRRVVVRVGHFTTAATLVAETDLVTAMPRSYAKAMKQRLPIVHRPLPIDTHPFTFSIAWNVQLSRDPAHQWFRALIEEEAIAAFAM